MHLILAVKIVVQLVAISYGHIGKKWQMEVRNVANVMG
jgi:hypothetical protein